MSNPLCTSHVKPFLITLFIPFCTAQTRRASHKSNNSLQLEIFKMYLKRFCAGYIVAFKHQNVLHNQNPPNLAMISIAQPKNSAAI